MFSRFLLLILIPGLLLAQAQKQNTSIPITPNVIQKQTPQPPAAVPKVEAPPKETKPTEAPVLLPEKRRGGSQEEHFFPHPGIVFLKNTKWTGDDHLYNLDNNIDIFIEVEKTKDVTVDINKKNIKELIASIFKQTIIVPKAENDKPPFPYFHMLIMITPIDKGYAVYCSGRLFESILPIRVELEKNMQFQAITWEKQALLIVPKDKLKDEIYTVVRDITNNFVERYRHFEDIKTRNASERR